MNSQIITFYSYKGGTGRTMILANMAWVLAANNKRVLTVDWDFEAPGLHRYFLPFLNDPDLKNVPGMLDQLWEYVELSLTEKNEWPYGINDLTDLANPQRYAIPLEFPEELGKGCLHFLGAGQQCPEYALRVNDFDWQNFYERLGGKDFINAFRKKSKEQYDYILIDSRTGVADSSGICTLELPDSVMENMIFSYLIIQRM